MIKQCANGTPGFDMEKGGAYPVRNACHSAAALGHIFCTECREGAGGYVKVKVVSRPSDRHTNGN